MALFNSLTPNRALVLLEQNKDSRFVAERCISRFPNRNGTRRKQSQIAMQGDEDPVLQSTLVAVGRPTQCHRGTIDDFETTTGPHGRPRLEGAQDIA